MAYVDRIKPLIKDALALVAGTDRKGKFLPLTSVLQRLTCIYPKVRVLPPGAPGAIFPPDWIVRPVGPVTFTVAPVTQPRELLAFADGKYHSPLPGLI